jgi:hypothetical protein
MNTPVMAAPVMDPPVMNPPVMDGVDGRRCHVSGSGLAAEAGSADMPRPDAGSWPRGRQALANSVRALCRGSHVESGR